MSRIIKNKSISTLMLFGLVGLFCKIAPTAFAEITQNDIEKHASREGLSNKSHSSSIEKFPLSKVESTIAAFDLKKNDKNNRNTKTISKHVDKSHDWLRNSFSTGKSSIRATVQMRSSFISIPVAERSIKAAMEEKKEVIYKWLNSDGCDQSIRDGNSTKRKKRNKLADEAQDQSGNLLQDKVEKVTREASHHSTGKKRQKRHRCETLVIHLPLKEKMSIGYGFIKRAAGGDGIGALEPVITQYEPNAVTVVLKKDVKNEDFPFFVMNAYPSKMKEKRKYKEKN